MILVTPKAGAKQEVLFNKPACSVFAAALPFQSSLLFVGKARSLPKNEAPEEIDDLFATFFQYWRQLDSNLQT